MAPGVPVLLGTNRNEGTAFVELPTDANASQLRDSCEKLPVGGSGTPAGAAGATKILAHYNTSDFSKSRYATAAWWAGAELVGDAMMACAARRSARLLAAAESPAFLYQFARKLVVTDAIEAAQKKPLGVFHGSELPLVYAIKAFTIAMRCDAMRCDAMLCC